MIAPGDRASINTGIACEIPKGLCGKIYGKSGLALYGGVSILGGVIDSDYRGNVCVLMYNIGNQPYYVKPGQKVAQMVIEKAFNACMLEVESLSPSLRGQRGFGSTGP